MYHTGDVVRVTRNDGKVYDCFVIEDDDNRGILIGRVLESSQDKVGTSSWQRYGLENNSICQLKEECKRISLVRKGTSSLLEAKDGVRIYQNIVPGSHQPLTFCMTEDCGGWSEKPFNAYSFFESYAQALGAREVIRRSENNG